MGNTQINKSKTKVTSGMSHLTTILRLWNPRNIGSALFHKKLETTHVALISLRSSDDWPRRPRVSCLYALQIGAQCQRPSFPPFLFHPGWLSIERAAKYLPTFSAPVPPSLH